MWQHPASPTEYQECSLTKLPLQIQDTVLRLTTLSPVPWNRTSFIVGSGGWTAFNGILFNFFGRHSPEWVMASSFTRFVDHTQRRTTVGRTPVDEWSAHRRGLYLTTHNTHNRQTSMIKVGFEPIISAGEWPQTYALDRAVTGTGVMNFIAQLNLY